MIPKGNQRGGGQQLATHLMNAFDNDRVEVAEVRGAVAQDLHGAFAEWYAQSKATNCRKYIYSLSINPDHRQKSFGREDYYDFIRRVEKKLRLNGQPRAVVFHVKYGREHCHVVWSRIDMEKGKAVQLSHDHQKLRLVAREYAKDHEIRLPPGMANNRGSARYAFRAAVENLGEKQQQDRSGITKKERREQISKLWTGTADARGFVKALEANGYFLARGDKRAYVVVDLSGEVHSLSRQLTGTATAKQQQARLGAVYDLDRLPSVDIAQKWAAETRNGHGQERKFEHERRAALEKRAEDAKREAQRRRDDLAKAHAARRADVEAKKEKLAQTHEAERKALAELHAAKTEETVRDRADREPKGVLAFLARITGYNAIAAWRERREDRRTAQEQEAQKDALARRHAREMEDFRHRESGVTAVEKREIRSLETSIRRETFSRAATQAAKQKIPAKALKEQIAAPAKKEKIAAPSPQEKHPAPQLTPARQGKVAAFTRAAAGMATPSGPPKQAPDAARTTPSIDDIKPVFTEAASGQPHGAQEKDKGKTKGGMAEKFNRKADATAQEKQPEASESGDKPREPAELTDAQRRALELKEAFNRRAGGRGHDRDKDRDREHYRRPPPDFSCRR